MPLDDALPDKISAGLAARARAYFDRRFKGAQLDRVLLVTPPDASASIFDATVARRRTYSNFPPYGHLVLAQHLRATGVDVRIINLNNEVLKSCITAPTAAGFDFDHAWQEPLKAAIEEFRPQMVGVTCMFTMTHDSLKRACEFTAQFDIPVVIGGVHVSNDVERILDDIPHADIAVVREGDVALPRLIDVIRNKEPISSLAQTIIRDDGQGRLRFPGSCMPSAQEMDVIPAYDLINVQEIARYGVIGSFHCFKPDSANFATALSNRGCRARCTFCSVRNFNGKGVRQRSVDSVLDELETLERDHGVSHIMWLDDDLLKDHSRAIELFNGMVRRGLTMTWDASNGVIASSCTDEVVAAAAASGCVGLIIGMESGNDKILRDVHKPGTVDTFLKAAEILRKYEQIYSSVYLMIGFPGETMGMMLDTVRVSEEMNLDWYRIKPLQPLPGTPIYDAMVEQGLIEAQASANVRYMTGAYGKGSEIMDAALPPASLEEAFRGIAADAIPTPHQVDDIWFYMNFALNYKRVFAETRAQKLRQHLTFVTSIADRISPDNPFALYTAAALSQRLDGVADAGRIARLRRQLESSSFWPQRFKALSLSLTDLDRPGNQCAVA